MINTDARRNGTRATIRRAYVAVLFQKIIGRRVRHALLGAGVSLVATAGRRLAAHGAHAQDGGGLRELTCAIARLDVEEKPRDRVAAGCGRGRLDGTHDLAAVAAFPGRAAVVLADVFARGVGEFGLGSLERPGIGAGVVL